MGVVRTNAGTVGIVLVGIFLLFGSGCSSNNEPRYPEDHERFQRIHVAIETLRQSYVQHDVSALQELMLAVDKLEKLQEDIRTDFLTFPTIALDFFIDRIMIDEDTIDVFLHWQGQWTHSQTDSELRERGHGKLRWVGVQSILLTDVEGDLPFGMATRQVLPSAPIGIVPK